MNPIESQENLYTLENVLQLIKKILKNIYQSLETLES